MTARLTLVPVTAADVDELFAVLDDPALHEFTGGRPDTRDELHARYGRIAAGPPRGGEWWLNWVVRRTEDGAAVGTVQATLTDGGRRAAVAWVIGRRWQRQRYASEAAVALVGVLRRYGAVEIVAHIHPDHRASERVAERVGLAPTAEVRGGERVWRLAAAPR